MIDFMNLKNTNLKGIIIINLFLVFNLKSFEDHVASFNELNECSI